MKSKTSTISGIILASGFSKRMGQNKLIMPINKIPMIQHVINAAKNSCLKEVIIVFPDMDTILKNVLNFESCILLKNPLCALGQAESIKVGIQHLINHPHPNLAGAMVLLGDQPFINPTIINRLILESEKYPMTWTIPIRKQNGQRGNPVIIPSVEFNRVLEIQGDTGARVLMDTSLFKQNFIAMDDDAPFIDIDTMLDYEKYK